MQDYVFEVSLKIDKHSCNYIFRSDTEEERKLAVAIMQDRITASSRPPFVENINIADIKQNDYTIARLSRCYWKESETHDNQS